MGAEGAAALACILRPQALSWWSSANVDAAEMSSATAARRRDGPRFAEHFGKTTFPCRRTPRRARDSADCLRRSSPRPSRARRSAARRVDHDRRLGHTPRQGIAGSQAMRRTELSVTASKARDRRFRPEPGALSGPTRTVLMTRSSREEVNFEARPCVNAPHGGPPSAAETPIRATRATAPAPLPALPRAREAVRRLVPARAGRVVSEGSATVKVITLAAKSPRPHAPHCAFAHPSSRSPPRLRSSAMSTSVRRTP